MTDPVYVASVAKRTTAYWQQALGAKQIPQEIEEIADAVASILLDTAEPADDMPEDVRLFLKTKKERLAEGQKTIEAVNWKLLKIAPKIGDDFTHQHLTFGYTPLCLSTALGYDIKTVLKQGKPNYEVFADIVEHIVAEDLTKNPEKK
jgi:hypothetical protein